MKLKSVCIIIQLRKLRHRNIEKLVQGQTLSEWRSFGVQTLRHPVFPFLGVSSGCRLWVNLTLGEWEKQEEKNLELREEVASKRREWPAPTKAPENSIQ